MMTRKTLSKPTVILFTLFVFLAFNGCDKKDNTEPMGPCADGHFLNIEFVSSEHGHTLADPTSRASGVDLVHFYHQVDQPHEGGVTTLRIHDNDTGDGFSRTLDLFLGEELPEAGEHVISGDYQALNKFFIMSGNNMEAYQLAQGVLTLHKAEVTRETVNAIEYHEVNGTFTGSFKGIDGQTGALDLTVNFCASPWP